MQGALVLIVDDDAAIRTVLSEFLTDEGYAPMEAADGRAAMAFFEGRKIQPDIVLLDLLMPEVDGYQVLDYMRHNLLQDVPVLIFSAQRPDASIHRALDTELRDFIAKPFDLGELLIRMERLLRRSPILASAPANVMRVYVLGALRVYRDDKLLFDESWRNKPAKTIFKILFTHRGRRYPKDVLTEELWPEADPDVAANRLRVAVHELRKVMGERSRKEDLPTYIAQQEGAYHFDASSPHWTDLDEFEQCVQKGRELAQQGNLEGALQQYQCAEALYQGDFLRDDPYMEWTVATRERLREAHLDMLSDVAGIYALQNHPDEAVAVCRKILRIEPWREEVYRRLMQHLVAAGRPHEALRAYEECRRALLAEVEAGPSLETERLRDEIAQQIGREKAV